MFRLFLSPGGSPFEEADLPQTASRDGNGEKAQENLFFFDREN
jgi:hypothetical protein